MRRGRPEGVFRKWKMETKGGVASAQRSSPLPFVNGLKRTGLMNEVRGNSLFLVELGEVTPASAKPGGDL